MSKQQGFTLIELVMVIVILGILAATAIPRFVDVSSQARLAAVQGVAGALASSSAMNYGGSLVRGRAFGQPFAAAAAPTTDTTAGCTNAAGALIDGVTFGAGAGNYTIAGGAGGLANYGDTDTCTVTSNDDAAATTTFVLTATN